MTNRPNRVFNSHLPPILSTQGLLDRGGQTAQRMLADATPTNCCTASKPATPSCSTSARPPSTPAGIASRRTHPARRGERRMAELPRDRVAVAYCRGQYWVRAHDAVRLPNSHRLTARRAADGGLEWRISGIPCR